MKITNCCSLLYFGSIFWYFSYVRNCEVGLGWLREFPRNIPNLVMRLRIFNTNLRTTLLKSDLIMKSTVKPTKLNKKPYISISQPTLIDLYQWMYLNRSKTILIYLSEETEFDISSSARECDLWSYCYIVIRYLLYPFPKIIMCILRWTHTQQNV